MEGGREGGREREREGERDGERERGMEGGREGRERERERERGRGRERQTDRQTDRQIDSQRKTEEDRPVSLLLTRYNPFYYCGKQLLQPGCVDTMQELLPLHVMAHDTTPSFLRE